MGKSMKMGEINIKKTANTVMILRQKCTWKKLMSERPVVTGKLIP